MDKNYTPKPIDTDGIEIPKELISLAEAIACNTHENWSAARIQQGWSYGPTRNDDLKTHPDLIPYEDLPEGEKEYDRKTSQETIKVILKLGFRILPPEH